MYLYFLQEDEKFLTELFTQLTDSKLEEVRRKELVLFLKEFCTFAQALQPPGRESFFKTLNNLGILQALEITLQVHPNSKTDPPETSIHLKYKNYYSNHSSNHLNTKHLKFKHLTFWTIFCPVFKWSIT